MSDYHIFFLQAEDGIRDGHVTGVQTCALPISALARPSRTKATTSSATSGGSSASISAGRSEERRVGKECRCRWSPNDEKKKREERGYRRPMLTGQRESKLYTSKRLLSHII